MRVAVAQENSARAVAHTVRRQQQEQEWRQIEAVTGPLKASDEALQLVSRLVAVPYSCYGTV